MSRLIDADLIQYELMLSAKGDGMYEDVMVAYKSQIDDLPTIEERKKGKWKLCEEKTEETFWVGSRCSECNYWKPMGQWNYCPNCGADMGGDDHETD